MEGKATNRVLLRPDPCPLDSRFHGNDIRGCRMPLLTPPQAGGVLTRHKKIRSFAREDAACPFMGLSTFADSRRA